VCVRLRKPTQLIIVLRCGLTAEKGTHRLSPPSPPGACTTHFSLRDCQLVTLLFGMS